MENPKILKIEIYLRDNDFSVIERVYKPTSNNNPLREPDFVECTGILSKSDEKVLLSRPQIAWLDNKEGDRMGEIPYRKVPDSEQGIRAHTRGGIEIRVSYKLITPKP